MEFYTNSQKVITKEKELKEKITLPKVLFEDTETKERETLLVYNDTIYNFLDLEHVYDLNLKRNRKGYIEIIEAKEVSKK